MKVCIVGLGSIGQRHLNNISVVAENRNIPLIVHALRSSDRELDPAIRKMLEKELYSYAELDEEYDAVLIANPTSEHFDSLKNLSKKTRNFFIEKPLFHTVGLPVDRIEFLADTQIFVAAPLRYSAELIKTKELLQSEKALSVRSICSSYLPDWRPGLDYRKLYCSYSEMGGGVELDIIHEWDYLTFLFGFPQKVYKFGSKVSTLELNSHDIAVYIASYPDKIVELHLDYFGREMKREMQIITEKRTIVTDFIKNEIRFSDNQQAIEFIEERNDMYLREMDSFFDVVEKKQKSLNNLSYAQQVLALALSE